MRPIKDAHNNPTTIPYAESSKREAFLHDGQPTMDSVSVDIYRGAMMNFRLV